MSIALLAPLGLVALVALVLPILIHLVRRIELTTTEFAALRWIAQRMQPRRRVRFERPWLLLLRLALLAALALLLARPVHDVATAAAQARVFAAPGADLAVARAAIASPSADWRWLAPGFPRIGDAATPSAVPLASLLREADAGLPVGARLVVVVPEQVAGLDGERRGAGPAGRDAAVDGEEDPREVLHVDDVAVDGPGEAVRDRVEALREVQPLHEQCAHCLISFLSSAAVSGPGG